MGCPEINDPVGLAKKRKFFKSLDMQINLHAWPVYASPTRTVVDFLTSRENKPRIPSDNRRGAARIRSAARGCRRRRARAPSGRASFASRARSADRRACRAISEAQRQRESEIRADLSDSLIERLDGVSALRAADRYNIARLRECATKRCGRSHSSWNSITRSTSKRIASSRDGDRRMVHDGGSLRGGRSPLAWGADGRPNVDRADLAIIGDLAIVEAFDEYAWLELPPAVQHHLLQTTFVVCGGINTLGWRACMPRLRPTIDTLVSRRREPRALMTHEIAHAWQLLPIYAGVTVAQKRAAVAVANEILAHKPPAPRHGAPSNSWPTSLPASGSDTESTRARGRDEHRALEAHARRRRRLGSAIRCARARSRADRAARRTCRRRQARSPRSDQLAIGKLALASRAIDVVVERRGTAKERR